MPDPLRADRRGLWRGILAGLALEAVGFGIIMLAARWC